MPSFLVFDRDEHWTGIVLDWILSMTNFEDSGLFPDCELLDEFRVSAGFGVS